MSSNFFKGLFAGFFASLSAMIFIIVFFSKIDLNDSILILFEEKKLAGVISIGALINLPLFFLAINRRKEDFAKGILIISIIIVILIAILKII